jgi:hypothetical protein
MNLAIVVTDKIIVTTRQKDRLQSEFVDCALEEDEIGVAYIVRWKCWKCWNCWKREDR